MKTLAAELLPNLVLWGLLLGAFLAPRPRFLRPLAVAATVLSIPAVPIALERAWVPEAAAPTELAPPPPGTAVMVFGAGVAGQGAGQYRPTGRGIDRAMAGRDVAARYGLPIFISGGRSANGAPSEARVTERYLRAFGHTGPVVRDETALSTWENAQAAEAALAREGWTSVVAVTSASHARRARACLRAAGVPVVALVVPDHSRFWSPRPWHLIPRATGLAAWRRVGYEIAGSASYVLRSRISVSDLF